MIAPKDIEKIQSLDISQIVGRYVALKLHGKHHEGLCPFHQDKHIGSFVVTDKKGTYHCFSCGAHGDGIKFVQEHLMISFPEAVKTIAADNGISIEDDLPPNSQSKEEYEAMKMQR